MKKNLTERVKNGRNGVQFVYILDCIKNCSRAIDEELTFATDFDALQFFFSCFDKEYNFEYNKKRLPNLAERIGDYLQGLPSCCNIDYWDDEILNLGISWGVLKSKEGRKAEEFIFNFFRVCGVRLIQAGEKVGVKIPY
jgi:hypothetical protein